MKPSFRFTKRENQSNAWGSSLLRSAGALAIVPCALFIVFTLVVGCAREERAAKILSAYVTKAQFNADLSWTNLNMPDEITCKDDAFRLFGGSLTIESEKTEQQSTYLVSVNVDFILRQAKDNITEERLTCHFKARWAFDFKLLQFRGAGKIESCSTEDYSCILGKDKIECEKLKQALERFSCT